MRTDAEHQILIIQISIPYKGVQCETYFFGGEHKCLVVLSKKRKKKLRLKFSTPTFLTAVSYGIAVPIQGDKPKKKKKKKNVQKAVTGMYFLGHLV